MIGNNPAPVKRYKTKLSYRDEMRLKGHSRDEIDRLVEKKRRRDAIGREISIKLSRR